MSLTAFDNLAILMTHNIIQQTRKFYKRKKMRKRQKQNSGVKILSVVSEVNLMTYNFKYGELKNILKNNFILKWNKWNRIIKSTV